FTTSASVTTSLRFFLCTGDRRVLHSFPTRRSSDLDGAVGQDAVGPERPAGGDRRAERAAAELRARQVVRLRGRLGRVVHVQGVGDRKSTRLNSSHQIISYAVFCLKKKK